MPKDDQLVKIGGFAGDIGDEIGAHQEKQTPIQVNIVGTNQADARQVIAAKRKKIAEENAKKREEEQRKKTEGQQQDKTTAPDNNQTQVNKSKEVTQGPALEKTKTPAKDAKVDPKENQNSTNKDNQNTQKKSSKDNKKTKEQKTTKTKPKKNQADKRNEEALSDLDQLIKESSSSVKTNAETTKAQQKALEDLTGSSGGDGAKTTDLSADTIARYKQRVQAQILRNFIITPNMTNQVCRISLEILRDGTLTGFAIREGQQEACTAGLNALKKTRKVPAPPENIYHEVRYQTIYFKAAG